MSVFLSPIEPEGQDISPASHVPLPWRSGEPRADTGAKDSHVPADAAWKKTLSMQPPRLRAAFCHLQSTITGLLTHSHDTSPSSAAAGFGRHCSLIHMIPAHQQWSAVCRRHPLIHTIPAPHQRLPCTEDSALSLIQGDMGSSRCKESPHPSPRKSAWRQGVFDAPARKSGEGEESPDAPWRKSVRRRLPDFAGLLHQLFTPLQSGAQLGRIA